MKLVVIAAALIAATTSLPSYDWKLTPAGWGPVRIGMTREQTEKALAITLEGEAFDNEGSCTELYSEKDQLAGMYFMFQNGKLSRITASAPSPLKTPRGMGVGSTDEEVRAAYGAQLQVEAHHYDGEPAEYLTYWLKPKASGVRFETDIHRKVQAIHAGDDSIELIEGCA